jgi:hypothetical protein
MSPSSGFPLTSVGAVAKMAASAPSETAIPIEPTSSSGLRPKRSIVAIATSVVRMLVTLVITVMRRALLSENPTESQRTLE